MKKLKTFSITIIFFISILFTFSCKKDKKEDDPNITYVSINKTITTNIGYSLTDSLDLNGDNVNDFYFISFKNAVGDSIYNYMSTVNSLFYIDSSKVYSIAAEIKTLNQDETPLRVDGTFKWYGIAYSGIKLGTSAQYGIAGQGDKFLPIAIRVGFTSFRYGWLRINLSSDYNTLRIKDGAYSTLDDTPIKMGAE